MNKKILFITLSILLSISCITYAFDAFNFGFTPIPAYITCSSGLSPESLTAVHNACIEINNASAGTLVYRTTYTHNTNAFPVENGKNEITKIAVGTNEYIMRTRSFLNANVYAYEADININVSHPFSNSGISTNYDVQNCITHEICHLLGLNDLGGSGDTEKTMYKDTAPGELKKRTLETDDKNGLMYLY